MAHGDLEHLFRVLAHCDTSADGIIPLVRGGQLEVAFGANDLFYWGCADLEMYESGDEPLLSSCVEDLEAVDPDFGTVFIRELFCCRKRGMRPQYPYGRAYDKERRGYFEDTMKPEVRALFDALGPPGGLQVPVP